MYICGACKTVQAPRTPAYPFVTEARIKEYSNFNTLGDPITSKGFETVREIKMCPECRKDLGV